MIHVMLFSMLSFYFDKGEDIEYTTIIYVAHTVSYTIGYIQTLT